MKERAFLVFLLSLLCSATAGSVNLTDNYPDDPYLAFRPAFVRSLPVQIMLTGVVLTLVAVLFIHLMFTAKYHWSLAPVNYVLQLSAVTTLLISLIATIHVILSASFAESERWPYMLSYIAVNVPPLDLDANTEGWTVAERATWLVMSASTSGLIQITHIQFLTLLYPSRLEGRLIFTLLGPLAIVAATMQLLLVTRHTHLNVTATAVRNVCNATLSLLFTSSLFIWGLLVNRKQAWRTDGGTAVFGCAALALALVSTALNFLYVHKEDEFVWLPGLMWAVVLWQSFLGWWWWVGAGSGVGSGGSFATEDENREEKLRREAKKADKREARKRRKEEKIKSQKISQDITAAFTSNTTQSSSQIHSRTPFRPSSHHTPPYSEYSDTLVASDPSSLASSTSKPESIMSQSSSLTATSVMSFPRILPGIIHRWYLSLRHAHVAAARQQTAKRNHRIEQFHRAASQPNPWWGGFGWRREVKETSEANGQVRTSVYEDPQLVADWQMRRFGGEASVTQMHGESEAEFSRSRTDHDCQNNNGNGIQGQPDVPLPPAATMRPNSMWWWGPLQRWRLQDSTVY